MNPPFLFGKIANYSRYVVVDGRSIGSRINGGEAMATNAVRTTQLRPTVHKRTEDIFFGMLTALVIVAVFIGFARTYFLAGMFVAKLPSWLVHLHGAVFTNWIVLLAAQVVLVSTGRVRWHMRLRVLGMFFAPLMVVVGFSTLVAAVRRQFVPLLRYESSWSRTP
jgi:magnesium-transporting ATPase (P-type)